MPSERDKASDSHFTLTVRIPKPSRRWLRVSLRTFLVLAFLATVVLGLWGRRVRESMEQAKYSDRVYSVGSLVSKTSGPEYESLMAEIKAIEPHTWGPSRGTIQAFPTHLAIVVSQTEEVHDKIAQLLAESRARFEEEARAP